MGDETQQDNVVNEGTAKTLDELQQEIAEANKVIEEQRERIVKLSGELLAAESQMIKPSEVAIEGAKTMGPMDDVFFNKMGEDATAIGEVISTVLGIEVEVLRVVPQYTIAGLLNRGVRLDSYSEVRPRTIAETLLKEDSPFGPKGAVVNVEVQKEDNDDNQFRVYYNGADIIVNSTKKGTKFKDLTRAIVIFISLFDEFGGGRLYYEVRKYTEQDKIPGRSPVTEIYINANAKDVSTPKLKKITDLMEIFKEPDNYNDAEFPAFSKRKYHLKHTKEGVIEVSKEYQRIIDEQAKKSVEEERHRTAVEMLRDNKPLGDIVKYSHLTEAVIRGIATGMGLTPA